MTTPNFTPDVPQWCVAAFAELRDRGYFNYSHHSESITGKEIISIIAKHAPRPEQPCRENLWQSAAEIAALMYESGVIESDAATPKWPRYFEDRQNRRIESRVMFTSESDHGRWADGFGELKSSFRDYAKHNGFIETDAEGNALSNSPETDEQRASRILGDPMRRVEMNTRDETPAHPVCRGCNQPLKAENAWMSDGCPCNNPRGINHGLVPKECCTCDECSPQQQQASGVERWDIRSVITLGDEPPYVIEKYRNGQFVKAADHDAAIATLRTRLSRAEQREAESEKYAAGILENLRGFLQLVELGCSVHRNAVVNRPRYYVADVDGKIVSEADEILVAMRNVAMPFNGGDKDA